MGRARLAAAELAMRQRQPFEELTRRLVGARPVERHHGGRHPDGAAELRSPPIADGHDLDLVHAAADGFLETMNRHSCDVETKRG